MSQDTRSKDIKAGMKFFPEVISNSERIEASVALLEKYSDAIVVKKEKDFRKALVNLVQEIATGYHDLVYHNFSHAVDVAHLMDFMVSDKSMTVIEDKHKFYLILTALVHDLGHFGFTNKFLNSDFANSTLTKNTGQYVLGSKKQTVMEAFHIEKSHELLERNAFFSRSDVIPTIKDDLHVWFASLILATDLANQEIFLNKIKDDPQGTFNPMEEQYKKVEAPSSLCLLLIKLADMGNVFREYECAFRWTEFVVAEISSTEAVAAKMKAEKVEATTSNILKLMQKEQGEALKKARDWTKVDMGIRMLGFAQNLVWPIVLTLKNFNKPVFVKLGNAMKNSLQVIGPNAGKFINEIESEVI